MEGADRHLLGGLFGDHTADALPHLAGGFIGEGDGEDVFGRNFAFQHVGDAAGDRPSLAGSSPRQDHDWAILSRDSLPLGRVERLKSEIGGHSRRMELAGKPPDQPDFRGKEEYFGFLRKAHFSLATEPRIPRFPAPCQEYPEKQRHGKPLPNASRSLVRAKSSVVDKVNGTCSRTRTANANAVLAKRPSSPTPTSRTSKRTCPSTEPECEASATPPFATRTAFIQPDSHGRHEQVRL